MGKCKHGHNHDHQTADKWTTIAAIGSGVTDFISTAYWLGTFLDISTGLEENAFGLSFYAMGFGVLMASMTALGSTYSHSVLNTNHQNNHKDESDHLNRHSMPPLTFWQKAALVGDFISHTGEVAGPITFVGDLVTKNTLPRWGKAIIQVGATLFGGISSVAEVRTCKNAMIERNQHTMYSEVEQKVSYGSINPS